VPATRHPGSGAFTDGAGLSSTAWRTTKRSKKFRKAALATPTLVRAEEGLASPPPAPQGFSLASWKQCHFNDRLLDLFIESVALDPTWVKNHPGYDKLRTYGAIAA
jgi:hypothetical protein